MLNQAGFCSKSYASAQRRSVLVPTVKYCSEQYVVRYCVGTEFPRRLVPVPTLNSCSQWALSNCSVDRSLRAAACRPPGPPAPASSRLVCTRPRSVAVRSSPEPPQASARGARGRIGPPPRGGGEHSKEVAIANGPVRPHPHPRHAPHRAPHPHFGPAVARRDRAMPNPPPRGGDRVAFAQRAGLHCEQI